MEAAGSTPRLLPHHPHIATSRRNAERLTKLYPTHRERILAHLRIHGAYGSTRAELAFDLGLKIQSVCPIVFRLREQRELIETDRQRDGGYVLVAVDNA